MRYLPFIVKVAASFFENRRLETSWALHDRPADGPVKPDSVQQY
jgi:hypothetical protein